MSYPFVVNSEQSLEEPSPFSVATLEVGGEAGRTRCAPLDKSTRKVACLTVEAPSFYLKKVLITLLEVII